MGFSKRFTLVIHEIDKTKRFTKCLVSMVNKKPYLLSSATRPDHLKAHLSHFQTFIPKQSTVRHQGFRTILNSIHLSEISF